MTQATIAAQPIPARQTLRAPPSYAAVPRCAAKSAMGDIDTIEQVKNRYLRALDTKHWDDFADTLTEDAAGD